MIEEVPGEPCRYLVKSSQTEDKYLVDLLERVPVGFCQCLDYQTRGWPSRRGCKHIRSCKLFYMDQILTRLAKERHE